LKCFLVNLHAYGLLARVGIGRVKEKLFSEVRSWCIGGYSLIAVFFFKAFGKVGALMKVFLIKIFDLSATRLVARNGWHEITQNGCFQNTLGFVRNDFISLFL